MSIAIIPARGGSKRIPRKNIKLFNERPIISYSIQIAKKSGLFSEVVVSTDDEEIKKISESYGAVVPFLRPKHISDDHTGTHEVIKHSVKKLISLDYSFDYACCIYPTAPFIETKDLMEGLKILKKGSYKSVFAASEFNYPIERSFFIKGKGLKMFFPEKYDVRSQDLRRAFHDAGQFYWSRVEDWLGDAPKFDENCYPIIIPSWRVQDIDSIDDWKRAETIFEIKKNEII